MPTTVLKINRIRMITMPQVTSQGFKPFYQVVCQNQVFYQGKVDNDSYLQLESYHDFNIGRNLLVYDDVKIEFFHRSMLGMKKIFYFWFNTSFIDAKNQMFEANKSMIDKANKDKKHIVFDENFRVEVYMSKLQNFDFKPQKFEKKDKKTKKIIEEYAQMPVEMLSYEQKKLLELAD